MRWDPEVYGTYADERGRPFADLVTRIAASAPRRVVDLGCGPGELTAGLARRWPDAVIEGVDSSPEMLARAAARIAAVLPLPKKRAAIAPQGFTRRYGNKINARINVVAGNGLDRCLK